MSESNSPQPAQSARAGASAPVKPAEAPQYKRIMINGDEDHREDVPITVNGHVLFIRRDEEVCIPLPHYNVIKQAVAPTYFKGLGGVTMESKPIARYKVADLGPGTAEEYFKLISEKRVMSTEQLPRVTAIMRAMQESMRMSNL